MLAHPNKRVIQALATLESDADFQEVMGWMRESLTQIDRDCRLTKDEVQTRWLQGAGQVIQDLLTRATSARETIRKF